MNLPLEIYLQMKKLANQILKKICSLVKLELLVAEQSHKLASAFYKFDSFHCHKYGNGNYWPELCC